MSLRLKRASTSDSLFFFNLRNDFHTRKSSFQKNKIKLSDHNKWFQKNFKKRNKIFLVSFIQKNHFVGTIRYDLDCLKALVSIVIDKKFRGKGYGAKMLKMSEKFLKKGTLIVSKVKKTNLVSIKLFEKNKYYIINIKKDITFAKLI